MLPNPEPTPDDIIAVSQITQETVESIRSAIAAETNQDIADAKWRKALQYVAAFDETFASTVTADDVKKVGPIEFRDAPPSPDQDAARLRLKNELRHLYGFAALTTESASLDEVASLKWYVSRGPFNSGFYW
jgi:hypothetical protein